jgi:hypothetical protein
VQALAVGAIGMKHIFRAAIFLTVEGLSGKLEGGREQSVLLKVLLLVPAIEKLSGSEILILGVTVCITRMPLLLRARH